MESYAELEETIRQLDAEIDRLDKLLRAARICPACGGVPVDTNSPLWPKDWKPQGPDHVPPGFCGGICGPRGPRGPSGLAPTGVSPPPPLSVQVALVPLEQKLELYAQLSWEIHNNSDWNAPETSDQFYQLEVICPGCSIENARCNELGEYTRPDGTEIFPVLVKRCGESSRTFNPEDHRDGS